MKKVGKLLKLFISKKEKSEREEHFSVEIDKQGVLGDKFYNKSLDRSILLSSNESYSLAQNNDIAIQHGELGENLLIDYNPYLLPTGTQLKIGEVTVQITQNCTICNHLSTIDQKLPTLLANDRGIFVKTIQGGTLYPNDDVYLI